MKNLCFVDFNIGNIGGIERVLTSLCNNLSDEYSVHLVSICGDYKKCHYNISDKVKCYNLGNSSDSRIRSLITASFWKLKKYIVDNNIDTVFMVGHFTSPIVTPLKPFVKSKFVFCDHGGLMNQYKDKKALMFRKIANKICDKTVVLTDRTAKDYINVFKTPKDKIVCIYNWLDEEVKKFTGNYDINSKKILTCGRLSSEKGYDMLVKVAKDVFFKYPDWQWDIYGDGEGMQDIKSRIKDAKIENNLLLKGPTDRMYEQYKNYAMYVLTSYREGLPLVLIEAKANFLPIVSFDCSTGPGEIVRNEIDGYLVECYDTKSMAEKICALIEDHEKRLEFSKRSTENLNLFEKSNILDKWKNLINNL